MRQFNRWWRIALALVLVLFAFSISDPLFEEEYSTVVNDRNGELLGARIADDGQWRFPMSDSLPADFVKAILHFEDEYYFYHPGVNPWSIARAIIQNISEGRVVSGGSTLTMQVIRLSKDNPRRTIVEKVIEIFQALRLEFSFSKLEILSMYAAHAPFGGNVVGLEAASWRYYSKKPHLLTLSECCLLAVLPNAPSLMYPGKNPKPLMAKRNRLLKKLLDKEVISKEDYELALLEPVPEKVYALPNRALHFLSRSYEHGRGKRINSSLETGLQARVTNLVENTVSVHSNNKIYNAAAMVVDVKTRECLSYVGNVSDRFGDHENWVDIIRAPRSTGSLLKPFLYKALIENGKITPYQIIDDIPVSYGGFAPKNFSEKHEGVVKADMALARSLNVPAIEMLRVFGVERFYTYLQSYGMKSLSKPSDHYGLSIILGGAEESLERLMGMYLRLAHEMGGVEGEWPIRFSTSNDTAFNWGQGLEGAYFTYKSLTSFRPDFGFNVVNKNPRNPIAWKTGTSFGNRDAWAIGWNAAYLVGVWVGNADGEGRPGLTGAASALPLMAKIFDLLPNDGTFVEPLQTMGTLCANSGMPISENCPDTMYSEVPNDMLEVLPCNHCQTVLTDTNGRLRYKRGCAGNTKLLWSKYFQLDPVRAYYFSKKNSRYRYLPPYAPSCKGNQEMPMGILFPPNRARLILPREIEGKRGKIIFEATHLDLSEQIFWHMDGVYLGRTLEFHKLGVQPEPGDHVLKVVDGSGNELTRKFEVITSRSE